MKKTVSLLLTLAMLLGLLQTAAFAAVYEISFEEQGGYKRTIKIEEIVGANSITVRVFAENSPMAINDFLAASPLGLSIPCDEPWESASVTFNGEPGPAASITPYDVDDECYYIEFDVSLLGTYVITNTTPAPTPDPTPSSRPSSSSSSTTSTPGVDTSDAPAVDTSAPVTSTETTENADGSTTKTETLENGAVVETTTKADGSSVSTATKTETTETAEGKTTTTTTSTTTKDASGATVSESREEVVIETAEGTTTNTTVVTESADKTEKTVTETKTTLDESGKEVSVTTAKTETETADGSYGTTTLSEDGKVEATTELSAKAVAEAAKSGEAVALPMSEVPAASDSESAPVVTVKTNSAKPVAVEIPVADMTPGVVAVIVLPDGTEKIAQQSLPTENGLTLAVSNGAVVKIIDGSEEFKDVHPAEHWGERSIDFASSRKLMNGTDKSTFSPNTTTTRGMVFTVLARFDGHDTTPDRPEDWHEPGTEWAVENGISSGEDPAGTVTREQIVTLLWRYAGSPAAAGDLEGYGGTDSLSDWAESAMRWAVANGIIKGRDGKDLAPQQSATRAEFTHMLYLAAGKL